MAMKIYNNVTELIGKTPLMRLNNLERDNALSAAVLAKLECFNPAGSVKDRVALNMINEYEKAGFLQSGSVIIEPTSGNTGIGLAAVAASRGYKIILTMPESMSAERRKLLAAYGAKIILTPAAEGMNGAVKKAEELKKEIPGSIIAGQFTNPANPKAHILTTGPELWEDTDGKIDVLVAGIGTGGTLSGIGRYLKEKNPDIKVIGVEPASSPLISGGRAGSHGLQGIGANFIPETLDSGIYDEILTVSDSDAYETGRYLAKNEGILVGITSGAAVSAAKLIAKRTEMKGKTIVAILPDTGERYLSTPMFDICRNDIGGKFI